MRAEFEQGLVNFCLDIRGSINGQSDPWDKQNLILSKNTLVKKLEDWDESNDIIDNAIKIIVIQTIYIIRLELEDRVKKNWDF